MAVRFLTPGTATSNSTTYPNDGGGGGVQFLSDNFSGAKILLSTTKENAAYSGACFRVRKVSNNAETDIGWASDGKNADASALATAISGSTGRVVKWYDQSGNGNDAIQNTTTKQWKAVVDTDSKVSFQVDGTGLGMEIADSSSYKVSKVHLFMVHNAYFGWDGANIFNTSTIIGYTPSGTFESSARWGININPGYQDAGPFRFTRNASLAPGGSDGFGGHLGEMIWGGADQASPFIWDFTTEDGQLRMTGGKVVQAGFGSSTNVTYPSSQVLMLGNNRAYSDGGNGSMFRAVILYDGTTVSGFSGGRNAVNSFLASSSSHNLTNQPAFTYTDADGFTWDASFFVSGTTRGTAVDANGLQWFNHHGGYPWSYADCTNVNNGVVYTKSSVHPLDDDLVIQGNERAERASDNVTISSGQDLEVFSQFKIEAGPTPTGAWCETFQIHYNDGPVRPDIFLLFLKNDKFVVFTGDNSTDTSYGPNTDITRDTWYAIRISLHWSTNHTSDTIKVWLGTNGGTLTKVVDSGPAAIFATLVDGAYLKQGVYRGDTSGNSGNYTIHYANYQASNTANAYSSFVTSQPALPTHA